MGNGANEWCDGRCEGELSMGFFIFRILLALAIIIVGYLSYKAYQAYKADQAHPKHRDDDDI